ncbi:MAG: CHAT domain-containing protein, partial [Rudaea sp.]
MALRLAAILVLLPGLLLMGAQTPAADEQLKLAEKLYTEHGPHAALPEYERVLALYRQTSDRRGEAIVLGLIGNCYKHLAEYPKALDYLQRALTIKQSMGDRLEEGKTHNHLGLVYWEMTNFAEATARFTRATALARETGNRQLEATVLNNLGLVLDEQGKYPQSIEHYRRALDLERATNHLSGESSTLGNIGGWHLLLGRYREALHYYQKALPISERLKDKWSMSVDLGNMALCQLGLGDVSESLRTFDRALTLAREAGLAKEQADWHKGKGEALARLGRYNPALEEYQLAAGAYRRAGQKRELIEALQDHGDLHLLLGDALSAEREFRHTLALARAIGHPRGVTGSLVALGDIEWRRKRYPQAATLYQEALAMARKADDRGQMALSLVRISATRNNQGLHGEAIEQARDALEIARASGARLLEAQVLLAVGEAERSRGRFEEALDQYSSGAGIARETGEVEFQWRLDYGQGQALESLGRYRDAVAAYRRAAETIESVRSQLREERFRAGYIEDKSQVYAALVRLLLKMGRPGEAFFFAEKLHARSYSDLLARSAPRRRSEKEIELRGKIRGLQRAIEEESGRPLSEQRATKAEAYSGELAVAEREYHNLLDELRSEDPRFAAARAVAVSSAGDLQRLLPEDAALIEYVVVEDGVAVFVLTSRFLEAIQAPVRSVDLRAKAELLRDLIARQDSDEWRNPAASLARSLIEPIERKGWLEGIRRLYIVPHGILHYIPFAALPLRNSGGKHLLISKFDLTYLPAAAALTGRTGAAQSGGTLLAMAPGRAGLPFAAEEARSIVRLFPAPSRVLAGLQATEASFKTSAGDFRLLHLATHGRFNKMNPLFSALELEPDRREDGHLEVHEIMDLRLNADLVTLSACDTALGSGYFSEIPPGDDFVGLTRAFLHAG